MGKIASLLTQFLISNNKKNTKVYPDEISNNCIK